MGAREPTASPGLPDGVLKDLLDASSERWHHRRGSPVLLFTFIFGVFRLSDDSMRPALQNGGFGVLLPP